jgi:hypothetical protein
MTMATQQAVMEAFLKGEGPKVARYLRWEENEHDAGRALYYSNPEYLTNASGPNLIAIAWGKPCAQVVSCLTDVSEEVREAWRAAYRATGGTANVRNVRFAPPEDMLARPFTSWFNE